MSPPIKLRHLGLCEYGVVAEKMREFTAARTDDTTDEIWLVQHYPVFTRGVSCKAEPRNSIPPNSISPNLIPVIDTDRGGQITYHGPGQVIAYLLLDIKRRRLCIKALVHKIEQAVINLLTEYSVNARRQCGAPGVYVHNAKIAALGLRIKHGRSFHGVSLNVAMDLRPYQFIDPCGYRELEITELRNFVSDINISTVEKLLGQHLLLQFN